MSSGQSPLLGFSPTLLPRDTALARAGHCTEPFSGHLYTREKRYCLTLWGDSESGAVVLDSIAEHCVWTCSFFSSLYYTPQGHCASTGWPVFSFRDSEAMSGLSLCGPTPHTMPLLAGRG